MHDSRVEGLAELRQENRLLGLAINLHRTLGRATSLIELLTEVCRKTMDGTGYALSCIRLADADKHKPVRFISGAGCDEACLERWKITWAELEQRGGAVATAIHSLQPVVCRRLEDGLPVGVGCAAAIKLRVGSVMILPLAEDEILLGLWFIYALEAGAFDSKEVTVLSEVGKDLARVIQALRSQSEQEKASAELATRYGSLTPREREVMELVTCGLPNKQIAAQLGTAEITVKVQRARVMKKMQARSIVELVRMADKVGSKQAGRSSGRWTGTLNVN